MRFRELHIENFGIHRDLRLEFAPGVQVLYGPNEAGKSTLLSLLRHLLFGIPDKTPYLKCSDEKRPVAVQTAFELRDGRTGRLRRQKGRPDQVTGEWTEARMPFDPAMLSALLAGASASLYENMFAFSSDELRRGSESLKESSLEEALFGGGLGGLVRYRRIEEELERRMSERFKSNANAKKQPINRLLLDLKGAREQWQRSQCRPQAYGELEQAYREQAEAVERLTEELEQRRRERQECRQWLEALPQFNQLTAAREERSRIAFPATITAEAAVRLRQLQGTRAPLAASIAALDRQLQLRMPLKPLTEVETRRLAAAGDIGRLQRELSRMTLLRDELPDLRRELERRQSDLAAMRAEYGPSAPTEITVAQRFTLRTLADELGPLQKRDTQLKTRRESLDQRLARPRKKFEKLGTAESLEEWEELSARCRSWRDEGVVLAAAQSELAAVQREADALLLAVSGVVPFDTETPPSRLPLRATVEDYRSRWQPALEVRQRAVERSAEVRTELQQAAQSLAEWDCTGRGDSRARVLALRQHRDVGWGLIRRRMEGVDPAELAAAVDRWTNGQPERLFDLYESAVTAADREGDDSLAHAEWHAVRNQREEHLSRLEERLVDAEEQRQQAEQTCVRLETDWQREWAKSGVAPRKPAEMLEWLDSYEEWQQARRRCVELAERIDGLQQRTSANESYLRTRLPQLPAAADAALRQVETRREVVRKQEEERTRLLTEIDEVQSEIEVLQEQERDAAGDLGDWRQRMQRLLRELRLPEDWTIDLLSRVLENIDSGRQTQIECDRLVRDVDEHESALQEFAGRVDAVQSTLGEERIGDDPVDAAELLANELDAAQSRQQALSAAEAESARDRALYAHQVEELAGIDRALVELCGHCQLADLLALERAAAQFDAAAGWDEQVRGLDRDLRNRLGTAWPAVAERLAVETAAGLEDRLWQIDAEIKTLNETQQSAIEQRGLAENRLHRLADETTGLALGAKLQSLRAALEQEAHQWAPLALTRAIMQRARERFEREHQPRILQEVSRLLARITGGEHAGIERALDGSQELLVLCRDGESRLRPNQLSTGTQAQLYLTIRLAFAADYCAHNEPLPLVMDDVLVTFDEHRARQTLQVLREFSEHTQVLLLTCHQRTVELWQSVQPDAPVLRLGTGANGSATDSTASAFGASARKKRPRRIKPTDSDDPVLFPAS